MPPGLEGDPSGHSPPVLVQIGQEIVLDGLPDREPPRGVLLKAARDELFGVFGDSWLVGKVDLLFDLYK